MTTNKADGTETIRLAYAKKRRLSSKNLTRVSAIALLSLTYGCSMLQPAEPENMPDANHGITFDSVADITCQPLVFQTGQDKADVVINESTARISLDSGTTPVMAYLVPQNQLLEISLDSQVINSPGPAGRGLNGQELFYPQVSLLDKNNQVIRTLEPDEVKYIRPSFTRREGAGAVFSVDNRTAPEDQVACMMIYTTDTLRKNTTVLLSAKNEYAKSHGVKNLPEPDNHAKHGNLGLLKIKMKSEGVMMTSPAVSTTVVTQPVVAKVPQQRIASEPKMTEIRDHYIDGVKQALEQGNISEALDQRAELKSVVSDAEYYFLQNYGKSGSAIQPVQSDSAAIGYAKQAESYYLGRMADFLKEGNGSMALQLLDDVRQLQVDVDHLFDR